MIKLKQDDIIEVTVVDYGMEGEGIAKLDEYTIFVPFVAVGEIAKVKVSFVKRNLIFADMVEIIKLSEARTSYECNRFMKCGGCDLLHLNYDEQLNIKRLNLIKLLKKNAGYEGAVDDTIASPKQFGYRNKIQLPFGTVNGKVAVGFFRKNTHNIVSITKCYLHEDWAEKLINVFVSFANDFSLVSYDDVTNRGLLRHLVARYIDGKICIVLVLNGAKLPHIDNLKSILKREYGDNYSFYISPHKEKNNVILGNYVVPIVTNKFEIDILGIRLEVNPFSFLQLNSEVRDLIYNKVIDAICNNTEKEKIVIDAYAGVGLMGAVLAKNGATIYNIEIVKEAIADAKLLYKSNGIEDKATQICGDCAIELPKLIGSIKKAERVWHDAFSIKRATTEIVTCDTQNDGNGSPNKQNLNNKSLSIILDPPRKGCSDEVINALNTLSTPHNLYYISCSPATLTRDLAKLKENYQIISITPFDMFPQTKHLETLVCLNKKA